MVSLYKNKITGKYRSKLEKTCAELLKEHNIKFEYEPWIVTLSSGFESSIISYETSRKTYQTCSKKIRPITYKPDFIGDKWVIEVKGMRTPEFNIKWKMFKKYLQDNKLEYTLFLPTSKKQILESINLINNGYESSSKSNSKQS